MKKVILLLLLASCASAVEGSKQKINVRTSPASAAECTVTTGTGTTKHFKTPITIEVERSVKPLNIMCESGGQKGTAKVLSDISNWGYGGAALGVGVGAVVDSATGAANEYPAEVVIKLGEDIKIGETPMNKNADFNK